MASAFPQFDDISCVICRAALSPTGDSDIAEVSRGLERLIEYSAKNNDAELNQYLLTKPRIVRVHNSCRRNYTSKRRYDQKCAKDNADGDGEIQPKTLRSSVPAFDWKIHCFFCNQLCDRRDSSKIRRVETF